MSGPTIKAVIRSQMKTRISNMSKESITQQSKYIAKQLINMPEFIESKRIGLYMSTPEEVQTDELVEHVLTNNKECFIPRYHSLQMEMVKLKSLDDFHNLPRNKWNIRQPLIKEERENAYLNGGLDLIVTPGLAFTPGGKRLGKGKGYYDRYLKEMKSFRKTEGKSLFVVGIAFNEQMLDDLFTEEHDYILDKVIYQK
ncbi:hypothetical protein O3M35_008955 [Rhynocoris fuscipes]|uniref:5-formyltetrahydrofolate cyclo-ligase n=1 Tax=Rhynocoris fuscipes TaxID=488301 RepID=A0AAW1D235_9HEMI